MSFNTRYKMSLPYSYSSTLDVVACQIWFGGVERFKGQCKSLLTKSTSLLIGRYIERCRVSAQPKSGDYRASVVAWLGPVSLDRPSLREYPTNKTIIQHAKTDLSFLNIGGLNTIHRTRSAYFH